MTELAKATLCLWYDNDALAAAEFYAKLLPNSHVGRIFYAPTDYPAGAAGQILTVEFTLCGIACLGINGGPEFKPNESFSLQIITEDQAETDRLWHGIIDHGGMASQCGWCKDRWGFSWQITPRILMESLYHQDEKIVKRVFTAMMEMGKIDIAAIEAATKAGSVS